MKFPSWLTKVTGAFGCIAGKFRQFFICTFVFRHININPFPDVSDNGDGVQFFNRLSPLLWTRKGSFEWKICMIIDSSLIYIIPLSDCECFMDYRG